MANDPFQADVARLALAVSSQYGFALGGGQALIAHGIVDRVTEDIDLFTDQDQAVQEAANAVERALRQAGFEVARLPEVEDLGELFEGFNDGMVELEIRREAQLVRVSLARLDRERSPVVMELGPVMHVDDCVASKVAAVAGRAQIRDFVDLAAATERYTIPRLIEMAMSFDPGLTEEDFADAGQRLDRLSDQRFLRFGLDPAAVADLRRRLSDWPRPRN